VVANQIGVSRIGGDVVGFFEIDLVIVQLGLVASAALADPVTHSRHRMKNGRTSFLATFFE
jgi:hypothetical protein